MGEGIEGEKKREHDGEEDVKKEANEKKDKWAVEKKEG